ncbi:ABC transporter ATP-binding protein [Streptomyces sp. NPDC092296]|uniref:ABC transporter ATP-binding protein n=1 Tax=Streptomyces sp. NPDC092296 TaxID=3366012 RepID=UPI0037F5EB83
MTSATRTAAVAEAELTGTAAGPEADGARAALSAGGLRLGYDQREVVGGVTLDIPPGRVTMIVGPNACGKSTLLRGLARLLPPRSGEVLLDGRDIHRMPTKEVAARLGILPQTPVAPDGIRVSDLVGRGRYPHQGWFRRWTAEDDEIVAEALTATDTLDLAARTVDELSGGQRQRVWIAVALAQRTELLLLDEPTTYLDLPHQVEVLDLLTDLNRDRGTTVVTVLHDLNLACRYGDHLIAMKDGRIAAEGLPAEVVTEESVREIFGMDCRVVTDEVSGTPLVLPIGRHHARPTAAV